MPIIKKYRTSKFVLAVLALTLFVAGGCGYHVAGKGGNSFFTGIHSMAIPVFTNQTRRADVESTITNAIVDEFVNAVDIRSVASADVVLEGIVVNYSLNTVSYTGRDVANEYRLSVVLSLRLVRRGGEGQKDEVLWEDARLTDYEDFIVSSSDVAATRDAEEVAFKKLSKDMARLVREYMIEGF
ncbi:hypothetical protein MNBD_DELTA01-902 [hydrothermal vent metagenome]|uniref:Uncharacterized protein n=1 Tax=hydrothermal vent metagenome TaxID=652676 RepID=A0A3B0QP95_9ZZZZ